MGSQVNRLFDHLARTDIHLFHRSWPAYRFAALAGMGLSAVVGGLLSVRLGLSSMVSLTILLAGAMGSFALTLGSKILTSTESYVSYRNGLAGLTAAVGTLWVWDQPVLPYLDLGILALGLCHAVGRAGCLMVGCCHGRPCRWGICYGEGHAAAGFTPYYVGIRLFPVQALELLSVIAMVAVGTAVLLSHPPPGTVFTGYAVSYAGMRFCLEFLRGDPGRCHVLGFSEAQWVSLLILAAVTGAEFSGVSALRHWHVAAAVGVALALAMGLLAAHWRSGDAATYLLLHPHHVREVAEAVATFATRDPPGAGVPKPISHGDGIGIACTSLGILISAAELDNAGETVLVYTVSRRDRSMDDKTAAVLARLIVELKHHVGPSTLVTKPRSVFHLLLYPRPDTPG